MKKFFLILIAISITLPSQAWWWDKKDKNLEAEMEGKGYAGTLPDISKTFKKEDKVATPIYEAQKDFGDPAELKPVPEDNPSFINIISKKDKTSKYIVDSKEIIPLLERLATTIEDEENIQLFVTRANIVTMNLDHLNQKYEGQPEYYYESFKKLMELNRFVKTITQLRQEAVTYQRYLSYQTSGSIYNPENINMQLQYLLEEINTAIIMLKQEY